MTTGPTQNYDDPTLGQWKPYPALAFCVRLLVALLPPIVAIGFGLAAMRWASPVRLGVNHWAWLAVEIVVATALLLVMARMARKLLPLSTLLRLTVYFPDRAPSRFALAVSRYSPDVLRRRVQDVAEGPPADERDDLSYRQAAMLLDLVASIDEHDHNTRGHSERVQAYAALIATEMGLSKRESAELSWAALLHDVGKIHTPVELLTMTERPTGTDWQIISAHPVKGRALVEPLAEWLGPWIDVVDQHHERWDGGGYPRGLAGTEISLGARIVAAADAFDVITSARSYKKPLSASAAREELARCAGEQFDPDVVRAFLALGLGRLQLIAGPASLLSGVPVLSSLPTPALPALASGSAGALAGSAVVAGGLASAAIVLAGPTFAFPEPTPDAPAVAAPAPQAGGAVEGTDGTRSDDAPASAERQGHGPADLPSDEGRASGPVAGAPLAQDGGLPAGQDAPGGQAPGATVPGAPAPGPPAAGGAAPSTPRTDQPPSAPSGTPAQPGPGTPPSSTSPATPSITPPPPPPPASVCDAVAAGGSADGKDVSKCNFNGRTITGDLSGAQLAGVDFSKANLSGANFTNATLNGADFGGATIAGTTFDGARLQGAKFDKATITGSRFVGATTTPKMFDGAYVSPDTVFGSAS
ncbi:HD domain-containing phosphohydrolase [Cellulomonas fimi]|uniref:HD domain-containing protein n=1 Tax=Cellulomonas fimi TaxID=1708 RepID=A0A7Y0QHC8_CELFI|nr:HD domain-containing phosphohydrolase [Cellulomonas fimi]NMR21001.1 HD domain-containing protein [Cellulomonas fimi]